MSDSGSSTERRETGPGAALARTVGIKARRTLKARRWADREVWFGLGVSGIIGWAVTVPDDPDDRIGCVARSHGTGVVLVDADDVGRGHRHGLPRCLVLDEQRTADHRPLEQKRRVTGRRGPHGGEATAVMHTLAETGGWIVVGALLGFGYFGGLWLTVRSLPQRRSPAQAMLQSFLIRVVVLILAIYEHDWRRAWRGAGPDGWLPGCADGLDSSDRLAERVMDLSPDWTVYSRVGAMPINATLVYTWIVMALLSVGSWLVTRRMVLDATCFPMAERGRGAGRRRGTSDRGGHASASGGIRPISRHAVSLHPDLQRALRGAGISAADGLTLDHQRARDRGARRRAGLGHQGGRSPRATSGATWNRASSCCR